MVPEGGKTMKGVNYYLNHEKQFCEFLNHGNVPLDNNATESALRNFCMHKHTWRLIDTINGAKASALVYSIVETAKANGLNPFRYLEFLLTEMMEHEEDTDYCFIDDLLPWSDSIPDICKMKNKKEHWEISAFLFRVLMVYRVLWVRIYSDRLMSACVAAFSIIENSVSVNLTVIRWFLVNSISFLGLVIRISFLKVAM